MKLNAFVITLALAASVCNSSAEDWGEWGRFRGRNGTGIYSSAVATIPAKITDANVLWKVGLPGSGHSSPVLKGEHLFLTTTGDKAGGISVLCMTWADGKVAWKKDFPLAPFARHEFNSFASSTPALDGERLYVAWNEPEHFYLTALDFKGNKVWQRDFGPFVSQHGCGISPIVYEGKVILGNEQDDVKLVKEHPKSGESFIVAVDSKTGKTVWQTPRKSAVVAYSTPCIYEPMLGSPQLIFNSQGHGIYAFSPDTGTVIWEFDSAFDKRSVSSPIIAGDIILGSCGAGGGGNYVTAVKITRTTDGYQPELAYQMRKSAPYVPTGIAVGNLCWLWSDSGILTCINVKTGDIGYQERIGGDFFGSPVMVNRRLYCVSTAGEIVAVEASDKFNVVDRYSLNEMCRSTPAIGKGRMFVRTENHLVSIGTAKR